MISSSPIKIKRKYKKKRRDQTGQKQYSKNNGKTFPNCEIDHKFQIYDIK